MNRRVSQDNDGVKQLPVIVIGWDADRQVAHLQVDQSFKSVDMAIAVVRMALDNLEGQRRVIQAQQLHAAQIEAQQAAMLAQGLKRR